MKKKEILIQGKNLCVQYTMTKGIFSKQVQTIKAVDKVSIQIPAGEIVGLVGESGSGKSSLGRALIGLEKIHSGSLYYSNHIIEHSKNEKKINSRSFLPYRRDYQIIFQDPYSSLNPRHTVFEILAEPLIFHRLATRKDVSKKIISILEKVGLGEKHLNAYPHTFSGGQRQRICIARILLLEPKVIICDEIVSALDLSVQAQIVDLLLKLKREYNLAMLWISHDLSLVRNICDTVHVMYLGNLVESGSCEKIFKKPAHPYTQALINSIPTLNLKIKPKVIKGEIPSLLERPGGCVFHTRCPQVQEKCKTEIPEEKISTNHLVKCFYA